MAHLEIERKFLLKNEGWRSKISRSLAMKQGYLSSEPHCSIRIRTAGQDAWLNLKSATIGAQRHEFEYAVPLLEAELMLKTLGNGPLIEKTRHFVNQGSHVWEIDEFHGENAGLIVAEIELDAIDEAFEHPEWLGQEVTSDIRYYNTLLAKQPYTTWKNIP